MISKDLNLEKIDKIKLDMKKISAKIRLSLTGDKNITKAQVSDYEKNYNMLTFHLKQIMNEYIYN